MSSDRGFMGGKHDGGHEGAFQNSGAVLEKIVGPREKRFYEQAYQGRWPPGFLPSYHGDKGDGRIGIENLMYGMKCPCVIDLKMGTATVEAAENNFMKKMKMNTLDMVTGSSAHGVRLEGMSVYRALESGKIKTTKAQSHAISAAVNLNLQDVLMFFLTDESGVRRDIGGRFLGHLERILHHFERANNEFLFIGSSILLIYDNDNTAPHSRWARAIERTTRLHPDTYAALRRKTRVDVRMIDFAHTGPLPSGQQRDEGYITGLKSIIGALRMVRKSGASPMRPIFSLAAAAAEVNRDSNGQASTQSGLPPLHESAPLLYPPQPDAPSIPHFNGSSYSFSNHQNHLSAPLQHSHSHSYSHAPPGGVFVPPTQGGPPPIGGPPTHGGPPPIGRPPPLGVPQPFGGPLPIAGLPPIIASPPPGTCAAYHPSGSHQQASHSGNTAVQSHAHLSQQLQHQHSSAQANHSTQHLKPANSESLHQGFSNMNLGPHHAGTHSHNGGHQMQMPTAPTAGYGPTFLSLMGLAPDQSVGAPTSVEGQPALGATALPSLPLI